MPNCTVSFLDPEGIRHSVEVEANSLYEAAVLAIKVFTDHDCEPGASAKLEVTIPNPITHEVTPKQLKDWLKRTAKSPRDLVEKEKLKELLGMKETGDN